MKNSWNVRKIDPRSYSRYAKPTSREFTALRHSYSFFRAWLWLILAALCLLSSTSYAACSAWRSPQRVWLNEYYFGTGGKFPQFLEAYSTNIAFPAVWQNWSIDVYSGPGNKRTYALDNTTAFACTVGNKTWLTTNVPKDLESNQALVLLKDNEGKYVDAFVFDNKAPPLPWKGATDNWFSGLYDSVNGCPDLAAALTDQAGKSGSIAKQYNMLVLNNFGNKDMARDPDGGPRWDLTTNTGSGTTYTRCVSNNANFTKTVVDNSTPPPGSTVTFTLNLTNTGNTPLSGVTIVDRLPSGLQFISAIPSNLSDPPVTQTTVDGGLNITWSPAPVAPGTTSRLYLKVQVPPDAVENTTYVNTAQTTAGLGSENQTDFASITIGSPNTPSFVISASPASSTTCTPANLGPAVTITAMSAANGAGTPLTTYNGIATLTASSLNPTWWYKDALGNMQRLPGNTVQLTNGTATLYLTDDTEETFTVTATDASDINRVIYGTSGNITFGGDGLGLTLTDADTLNPGYGVVAGRPHAVKATISSCGTKASLTGTYSGTVSYDVSRSKYQTIDPGHTINPVAASCPGSVTLNNPAISLTFTSGEAIFYLCAKDVAQYALKLTLNNVPSGNKTTTVSGISSNFTSRPFVITATGFKNGGTTNPLGASAFAAAGSPFSGTLQAWPWLASMDKESPRGNGLPDSGVTASMIVGAQSASFSPMSRFSGAVDNVGVVSLAPTNVVPVGGTLGTLSPTTATLVSGTITRNDFSYSEVGTINMGGAAGAGAYTFAVTNYLGAAGVNVPILSDAVGRFTPHHFSVSAPSMVRRQGCTPDSIFTYMDEPFSIGFTLTAQNANNETTRNYAASLAFLDPATDSWTAFNTKGSFGLGAINGTTPLSSRLAFDRATSSGWAGGVNTISADIRFRRATGSGGTTIIPDGPYSTLKIGIAPQDKDGVKTSGLSLDADGDGSNERVLLGTTDVRFGRLKLSNAFGAEKAALNIPVQAQYWSGKSWVLNGDDSCTRLAGGAVKASGYVDSKGAPTMAWSVSAGDLKNASGTPGLASGQGFFTLTKMPATGSGSVNICVDLGGDPSGGVICSTPSPADKTYLQGKWPPGTNYDNDPSARATFGIYSPENRRTVHIRELF